MAISKLIKTITETSKYEPKIILKAGSVHSGRSSGIGLISAFVVCPNTAKNKRSNAMNGVIVPFIVSFCFSDLVLGEGLAKKSGESIGKEDKILMRKV